LALKDQGQGLISLSFSYKIVGKSSSEFPVLLMAVMAAVVCNPRRLVDEVKEIGHTVLIKLSDLPVRNGVTLSK